LAETENKKAVLSWPGTVGTVAGFSIIRDGWKTLLYREDAGKSDKTLK
jgi:hypothetical protein